MPDMDAVVNRMLARFGVDRPPEVDRALAAARTDPGSWLAPATELLRTSWNEDRMSAAAATAALMGLALDTAAHDHPQRARWALHLWLAERTLSALYGDYRLSQEVRHRLAAQTQNRAVNDPVAVAATYPDLPPPGHFEAAPPIERDVERLVAGLPPDDLSRAVLLARAWRRPPTSATSPGTPRRSRTPGTGRAPRSPPSRPTTSTRRRSGASPLTPESPGSAPTSRTTRPWRPPSARAASPWTPRAALGGEARPTTATSPPPRTSSWRPR
ncbi:hypothetical protein RB200_06300 [Streptomyces sp. PmtG]